MQLVEAIIAINPDACVEIVRNPDGSETIIRQDTDPIPNDLLVAKMEEYSYIEKRTEAYRKLGSAEKQLEMIYEDFDGWRAKIKEIRDKYPSPSNKT